MTDSPADAAGGLGHGAGRRGLGASRRATAIVLAVVGIPFLSWSLAGDDGPLSLNSVLLLHVMVVVLLAALGGAAAAAVAAIVAVLSVNWFLTPPFHTFAVASRDGVVELVVFGAVATVVGFTLELAVRARSTAVRSRQETDLIAEIATLPPAEQGINGVMERIRTVFALQAVQLVRPHPDGAVTVLATAGSRPVGAPTLTTDAGGGLRVDGYGSDVIAEDRQLLERLSLAATRAWQAQHLASRADQLAEVDQVRSALLLSIGHDLRTPLAAAKTAVTNLRDTEVAWSAQERAELLATIEESVDRQTALVTDLLDLSRVAAGVLAVSVEPTLIDVVCARAALDFPHGAVTLAVPEHLPVVATDPVLLERVIGNLVSNAIRHSGSTRPVTITAGSAPGGVAVAVVDHGHGMDPDTWALWCTPFRRLDDSESRRGAGLGLAIVAAFCDALHIEAVPSVTPGGGLTVTVTVLVVS